MYEIKNEKKFLIISNGVDVVHRVQNNIDNVTTTGQPFMLIGDTEEFVNDIFYKSWKYVDNISHEFVATPRPIYWITGHSSEQEAQNTCDFVMSLVDFILLKPIKHPSFSNWANPLQSKVIEAIPSSSEKYQLLEIINNNLENTKSLSEMVADGWFTL